MNDKGTLYTEIIRCLGWEELIGQNLSDQFLELAWMQINTIFNWDFWNVFNPKILIVILLHSIWINLAPQCRFQYFFLNMCNFTVY